MKYFSYILISTLIIFTFSSKINAQINVIASIAPIANLASMLLEDKAKVEVIASSGGCPHHYHAKPSDLKKIKNADLIIYIDADFDGFIANLTKDHQGNIFKISDIKNLNLISDHHNTNWHIWLDLANVRMILTALADKLILLFPEHRQMIIQNLEKAKYKVSALQKFKNERLSSAIKPASLAYSLEYFFLGTEIDLIKLNYNNQNSLKFYLNLEDSLHKSSRKCLIIDNDQNIYSFKKLKTNVIQIDPENWPVKTGNDFIASYAKITRQISSCIDK